MDRTAASSVLYRINSNIARTIIIWSRNLRANQVLDRTEEIKRQFLITSDFSGKNDDGMRIRLLVADSIERILDRIENIVELSIICILRFQEHEIK